MLILRALLELAHLLRAYTIAMVVLAIAMVLVGLAGLCATGTVLCLFAAALTAMNEWSISGVTPIDWLLAAPLCLIGYFVFNRLFSALVTR